MSSGEDVTSLRRHAARLASEAWRSASVRGLTAGAGLTALGAATGMPWRHALLAGSAVGLLHRQIGDATLRLQREIRSGSDGAVLAARFTELPAFFGGFAIDADAARLIVSEMESQPKVIVECGAGMSTFLIGSMLKERGEGKLYSIESLDEIASEIERRIGEAGLAEHVEIIVAPLKPQSFGTRTLTWYDVDPIEQHVSGPIDLLVVDGPPVHIGARAPALDVFWSKLSAGAAVLVDDGRRRHERRMVLHWALRHDDELDVYWVDSVKGGWKLVKRGAPTRAPRRTRVFQRAARLMNPNPTGMALYPVRR